MARIGILGGTFSPAHLGHQQLAVLAQKALNLQAIYIMPCQFPPHKANCLTTHHRLNILRQIFMETPAIYFDFSEILRNGPSLTHVSLESWQKKHPNDELYFIQGSDSFATITDWEYWSGMIENAQMIVVPRGTQIDIPPLWQPLQHRIHILNQSIRPISSSEIRESNDASWIISQMGSSAGAYYLSNCR
ncbi:nicotinate (nicotinamide) nucleotide adenylyltransferase [Gammaproteobacteria bacterium]|nr:nicotinate (nicotinamide) nucleotide adenylyltransferase [Gammaproteobacteria bacterium]